MELELEVRERRLLAGGECGAESIISLELLELLGERGDITGRMSRLPCSTLRTIVVVAMRTLSTPLRSCTRLSTSFSLSLSRVQWAPKARLAEDLCLETVLSSGGAERVRAVKRSLVDWVERGVGTGSPSELEMDGGGV
jgi:hypothetical protein